MTNLGYGTFGIDSAVYPIDGYDGYSALQLIDPVIYYLLDYNKVMLQAYLGNAWTFYVNQLNVNGKSTIANTIVNQVVPYNPVPHYYNNTNYNLPMLALYRVKSKVTERTRPYHRKASTLEMLYVLPPMSASQTEKLYPFLNGVADVVIDRNEIAQDPNYNNNQDVGQLAQFEGHGIDAVEWANIPVVGNTNLYLPTLKVTMLVNERRFVPANAFQPITGFDATIGTPNTNPYPIVGIKI